MTHSGGQPHKVGYAGQRYEVCFFNPETGKRQVMGWTNSADGAADMADAVELHAAWCQPWVTDLQAETHHSGHPAGSMVPDVFKEQP